MARKKKGAAGAAAPSEEVAEEAPNRPSDDEEEEEVSDEALAAVSDAEDAAKLADLVSGHLGLDVERITHNQRRTRPFVDQLNA